jgi:hypothetical protein
VIKLTGETIKKYRVAERKTRAKQSPQKLAELWRRRALARLYEFLKRLAELWRRTLVRFCEFLKKLADPWRRALVRLYEFLKKLL